MQLLIFLLSFLNFFITGIFGFTPSPRAAQTSVLVDTKLYYAGGFTDTSLNSNEIFYLDLSNSFQTSNPPWESLAGKSMPISSDFSTFILSPIDNSTIYLIGGYMLNPITLKQDFSATVYTFDSKGLRWNTPSTSGSAPVGRQQIGGVVDKSGKVYIFGGCVINNYTTFTADYYNDINILDVSLNAWTTIQAMPSSPTPRVSYTATLLSDGGVIVYIGGEEYNSVNSSLTVVDMKNIQLFDTKSLTWTTMRATGVDVQGRLQHTAVLTKDGQIMIYGGEDVSNRLVTPNLASLDTTVNPYNWRIPTISTGPNDPPPLSEHSANLYEDCMIIAFGFIPNSRGNTTNLNRQVYILNITSNSWVTTFNASPKPSGTPSPSATPTKTPDSGDNQKPLIIAVGVSVGIIGLIAIGTLIFCLTKRRRNKSEVEVLRIPSDNVEH